MTTEHRLAERFADVGRYTYRGRHTATFLGVPASNAEIEMHSIDIWRVRDGVFAEHWDELNTLDLFQQIGAIPPLAVGPSRD